MKRLMVSLVLIGGLAASARRLPGQAPSPTVDVLIRQLGSFSFEERRQASLRLRDLGLAVMKPLRRAAESDDPEVRHRARELLEEVEHIAQEQALSALLSGSASPDRFILPGWTRFRNRIQDDSVARFLFADMLQTDSPLLRLLDDDRETLQAEFERRCGDLTLFVLRHEKQSVSPHQTAALLFVGAQPECRPSPAAAGCINNLVMQPGFRTAALESNRGEALKRLLGAWVAREDSSSTMQRLTLAAQFELPEGVDVALEIMHGRARGIQLQYAIFYLAKAGGSEHIHELEALLTNDEQLTVQKRQNNVSFSCLVKDAALVALVHMTGQDPIHYGFTSLQPNSHYVFAPNSAGFESEEMRSRAFQKWDDWRAENLKDHFPLNEHAIEGVQL